MIRSVLAYAKYMTAAMADPTVRAMVLSHAKGTVGGTVDRHAALGAAVGYLLRAQQQGSDVGMGSYHLSKGWGASYPETTGYAIPTLLAASKVLGWSEPRAAAMVAVDWLLTIQRADGGWQGGRVGEGRPSIVFNTAQVVRGLLAAHTVTQRTDLLEAALRAGRWIASVQDADGAWRTSNFMGAARVYDTYVDAPLLWLHALTGEEDLRSAALRNLEWVIQQRQENGWFANADNTLKHNGRPITHTIAYTLDGLIECSTRSGDDRYLKAARSAALILAEDFLINGRLNGRYDATWRGTEHPIMTGCAQLAIVWSRLYAISADDRFHEAHERMVAFLVSVQRLSDQGPSAVHGALPGSFPLWGRYEKFAFPNWGTKYFADALLCAEGHPPVF